MYEMYCRLRITPEFDTQRYKTQSNHTWTHRTGRYTIQPTFCVFVRLFYGNRRISTPMPRSSFLWFAYGSVRYINTRMLGMSPPNRWYKTNEVTAVLWTPMVPRRMSYVHHGSHVASAFAWLKQLDLSQYQIAQTVSCICWETYGSL